MLKWRKVKKLKEKFPEVEINHPYGYLTKTKRMECGIEKSKSNDAFVIAGGTFEPRSKTHKIIQVRRNNRSLEKIYGAKYQNLRTGKKPPDVI